MKIQVTIKGVTPLLMARFSPEMLAPKKKNKEETIAQIAESNAYRNEEGKLFVPGQNIFRSLMEGGRYVKEGKRAITNTKNSILCAAGDLVEKECILDVQEYEILSMSAVNNAIKARIMTHKPMFKNWRLSFTLLMDQELLSSNKIKECILSAGKRVGLGSFRPDCKGTYGKYEIETYEVVDI